MAATVVNPLDEKLVNRTNVHCPDERLGKSMTVRRHAHWGKVFIIFEKNLETIPSSEVEQIKVNQSRKQIMVTSIFPTKRMNNHYYPEYLLFR
jgi:hypothetical protein